MDKPLTIKVNGIGPVLIEHSRRAKRVSISVKAYQGVRVAVPLRVSFNKALEFVQPKKPWIQKHLVIITRHETENRALADLSATIDRVKARKVLTRRLKQLTDKHGFVYNRVFFRNQKTRWGSCSSKNNISLNIKLITLPEELVDYVILHELVHTQKKDHSKVFWAEMDRIMGDGKKMALKLRKYGIGLY